MDSNKQRTDVKGSQVYFGKLVTPFKFYNNRVHYKYFYIIGIGGFMP